MLDTVALLVGSLPGDKQALAMLADLKSAGVIGE
jgi:hypothetical protein